MLGEIVISVGCLWVAEHTERDAHDSFLLFNRGEGPPFISSRFKVSKKKEERAYNMGEQNQVHNQNDGVR